MSMRRAERKATLHLARAKATQAEWDAVVETRRVATEELISETIVKIRALVGDLDNKIEELVEVGTVDGYTPERVVPLSSLRGDLDAAVLEFTLERQLCWVCDEDDVELVVGVLSDHARAISRPCLLRNRERWEQEDKWVREREAVAAKPNIAGPKARQ